MSKKDAPFGHPGDARALCVFEPWAGERDVPGGPSGGSAAAVVSEGRGGDAVSRGESGTVVGQAYGQAESREEVRVDLRGDYM